MAAESPGHGYHFWLEEREMKLDDGMIFFGSHQHLIYTCGLFFATQVLPFLDLFFNVIVYGFYQR